MPEKDFQIRFSARDDGTYGRVIKQTADGLRSLKADAASVASSFTGGLIGGGLVSFFLSLIGNIQAAAKEARELKRVADGLNISVGSARGFKNLETGIGLPGVFTEGIREARRRRADALAGDPEAIQAFEEIGVSLKAIKDLSPDALFFRIAKAFENFDEKSVGARERFFAGASLLGGASAAESLVPYFRGNLLKKKGLFFGDAGRLAAAILDGEQGGLELKRDFEPFSSFGVDTRKRANKLGEDNRNRAIDLLRSQLPPEEQLNRLLAERVALEREISAATSPLRREQLVSRLLDLNGNILGLDQQQRALAAKNLPTGSAYPRALDELSRAGFFTGGSPSQLLDINRQQLRELQKSVDLLRGLPAGLGNEI